MADFPKKILLVSTMRSGTHYVADLLAKQMGIRYWREIFFSLNKIDIDEINFLFGSDKTILYAIHWESVEGRLSHEKLDQLNAIIKNRNIYVIFLDRKDFKEQLISRTILMARQEYNLSETRKLRIKKTDLEKDYIHLKRIKYYNNPSRVPLSINEQIWYEDILKYGLNIAGTDIELFETNTSKSMPKEISVTNYKDLFKWINEFDKKYDENWIPAWVWPERE